MIQQYRLALLAVAITSALVTKASAAGFQLQNQDGSGAGNAFAGAAAAAEDAGTVFFNPAGMTMLPAGHSFAVAATVLDRSVKFTNAGTTNVTNPPTASDGRDAGGTTLIPAFFWSYAIDPAWRLGLGISPTYGNKSDYGYDFVGRNSGYYAKLVQINVNPSVAFKVNDRLSLGLGLNYATNESTFRQGYPLAANASSEIKGDDTAFGYNVGLMVAADPDTRLAFTWRSELRFRLDGHLDISATPGIDFPATAKLTTPAAASLAVSRKLNPQTELLADITWTDWSVVSAIDVVSKSTGATLASLNYNFRDTVRVGLGANYQHNDAWKLRIGTAWDQTPVKSPADRTMTLPDSDRLWLAFGAKYRLDRNSTIDIGYAHIFFADASTRRPVAGGGAVIGKWDNGADLLSVQWNYQYR